MPEAARPAGGNAEGCSRQWIPREVLLSGLLHLEHVPRRRSQKRSPGAFLRASVTTLSRLLRKFEDCACGGSRMPGGASSHE